MVKPGPKPMKPDARRQLIALRVKMATKKQLAAIAKELGLSQGELIDAYVDGPKPPRRRAP